MPPACHEQGASTLAVPVVLSEVMLSSSPDTSPLLHRCLGVLLALGVCAHAQAGRPMVVDDAVLTTPEHCQVESWVQHSAGQLDRWAVPACNLGGQWEIAAGVGQVSLDRPGAAYRLGLLQAKTVFHALERNGWGIGLTTAYQFRQGEGRAGDVSVLVPVSVSLLDDKVLVHMNGGWTHARSTGRGDGFAAAGAEWALQPVLSLTLEAYGTRRSHAFAQVGMSYTVIPDRIALDAGIGRRIGHAGAERYVTAGLTLTSPALR